MRLNNLRFPGEKDPIDLLIGHGRVTAVLPGESGAGALSEPAFSFENDLVFPGLINSHDHLDFNLFPQLASRIYENYIDWGRDIHSNNAGAINAVLQVPQSLRTAWGVYKNLLNGFTTVVNHGEKLAIPSAMINVFQDCHCLHSVGFEQHWQWKLNRPAIQRMPFVLHVGEGTDKAAGSEIDRLLCWNYFKRPLIGVHGVAMSPSQAAGFRALVWCPASNYFLLDTTAAIDRLKDKVPLLFGTDSTLTASWNAWIQIRLGRGLRLADDREILDMLTASPAKAWRLKDRGTLEPGMWADLVIARPKAGQQGMDAFYGLDPEDLLLVLHEGNVRLFDPSLLNPLTSLGIATDPFHQTKTGGKFVSGDLPGLMQEIRRYYPEVVFPPMP